MEQLYISQQLNEIRPGSFFFSSEADSCKVYRMAADKSRAMTQLCDITECCICLKTFTDPRSLPCIHTFCFQCLHDLAASSNKKSGDQIQCPVCKKELTIPNDGIQGVQKNFFMARLIEVTNALKQSKIALLCDICKANNDSSDAKISEATVQCLVCQENLCEGCCKMHKSFKMFKSHKIIKIGSELGEEEVFKTLQVMHCDIHLGKALDYYCADCKKFVCVYCFAESHKTHDCKDVNTVGKEFRQSIRNSANIISTLAEELLDKKNKMESKEEFLRKIATRESEILQRSKELKEMIDEHTKSLLSSLDEIKNRHLKEIHVEEEELDRRYTILESFSRYCEELRTKGSASEVYRSKEDLLRRADELEEDHDEFIVQPRLSFDVTFQAYQFEDLLCATNANIIGHVDAGKVEHCEDSPTERTSKFFSYKIHLRTPKDIDILIKSIPTAGQYFPAAAVYNDTVFVIGVGEKLKEIWKYEIPSSWRRCGSLVHGRENHYVEFIGETMYTCGGSQKGVIKDSIEAYNVLTEKSTNEGRLRFGSQLAACVAYKESIYVFGGLYAVSKAFDCVQVYNPASKICTVLSTPMPRPKTCLHAVVWRTYAILLCSETCFIFDFESEIWQENKQLKVGALSLGLVLENERIFTFGKALLEAPRSSYTGSMGKVGVNYVRASRILKNEEAKWKSCNYLPRSLAPLCGISSF